MKKAGDILSALFDERFVKEARGYSKLFDSWTDITAKNGIAAAADYSQIKELEKGVLFIEVVHPGWKQILQTKQSKLLNDFRRRFPQLDICGISLMLGKPGKVPAGDAPVEEVELPQLNTSSSPTVSSVPPRLRVESLEQNPDAKGYDAIKDEEFKEALKNLGQTIANKEKK